MPWTSRQRVSTRHRIVSLAAWRVQPSTLDRDFPNFKNIHIVVDPGRKSHPRAEEVHGYSDWVLRHQQPFSDYADAVHEFLTSADIVVAHNATFDLEFIDREYRTLGRRGPQCRKYCTMQSYRTSGASGRASLKAICQSIGLERVGKSHGALEDAWLALMVYFWLNKQSQSIKPFLSLFGNGILPQPSNLRDCPPVPDGPLPRRARKLVETILVKQSEIEAKKMLLRAVRPTAFLLLEVARADEAMPQEEMNILVELIRTTRSRLGMAENETLEQEILSDLFEVDVSQNILTRSARALCNDPTAREAFPRLLAGIATADGHFSPREREAVDRVKAAINRVLD